MAGDEGARRRSMLVTAIGAFLAAAGAVVAPSSVGATGAGTVVQIVAVLIAIGGGLVAGAAGAGLVASSHPGWTAITAAIAATSLVAIIVILAAPPPDGPYVVHALVAGMAAAAAALLVSVVVVARLHVAKGGDSSR